MKFFSRKKKEEVKKQEKTFGDIQQNINTVKLNPGNFVIVLIQLLQAMNNNLMSIVTLLNDIKVQNKENKE